MVVMRGNKVIGGRRTIISRPHHPTTLPLETDTFALQEALPRLNLHQKSYSELTRLAILPEHRSHALLEYLIRFEIAFSKYCDIDYILINAPMVQARTHRKITRGLGFDFTILHQKVAMPVQSVYRGLNRVVLSVMPFDENIKINVDALGVPERYRPVKRQVITKGAA